LLFGSRFDEINQKNYTGMPIDVKQGQMLIRKIQYLLDGLELNAAEISNIEKDLMLGYISSLYELFLFDEQVASKPMTKPKKVVPNVTKPVRVTKEVNEITPPTPKVEVKPRSAPKPTPAPEPVVEPEPIVPEPPKVETPIVEKPAVFAPPVIKVVHPDHESLFAFKKATDLSEKLRDRPIADLNKAFAINDKLLTISKLFDGDAKAFEDTVRKLNQLSSFDEAKVYLSSNVVDKFNWTAKSRAKTAKIFIKTIKRRFL